MPFWRRQRPAADDHETYEEPVEARTESTTLPDREARRLAKLRKKAHRAAQRASRESEKARKAARKVREASTPSSEGRREAALEDEQDVPGEMAGPDRAKVLAKKDRRRLKKLRRKAQKSS